MLRHSLTVSLRIGSSHTPLRCLSTTCPNSGRTASAEERDIFRLREYSEKYLGGRPVQFTEKLTMIDSHDLPTIPIYRVTDAEGKFIDTEQDPGFTEDTATKIYRTMTQLNILDKILYDSQRQGRISFYMTNYGEEANQLGSAVALENVDLVYAQYREAGVLMWRGYSVQQFVDTCYGNKRDTSRGKHMPVCYGSTDHNFVTVSPPLTVQLPQAVGSAYAFKRNPNNDRIVCVYVGEGAVSEGDAHAAFNFAATLDCPIIFFCRNNGYAISTPTSEQYAGDGIAGKGPGYGLHTIRVDGNDLFAVYNAVKEARQLALSNKPVLIEAMTYRLGHHSTSDDSTAYRTKEEVQTWSEMDNPINRFKSYITEKGWWNDEKEEKWQKEARDNILSTVADSEKMKLAHYHEMFEGVYDEMPENLRRQREEMDRHMEEYGKHYSLEKLSTK